MSKGGAAVSAPRAASLRHEHKHNYRNSWCTVTDRPWVHGGGPTNCDTIALPAGRPCCCYRRTPFPPGLGAAESLTGPQQPSHLAICCPSHIWQVRTSPTKTSTSTHPTPQPATTHLCRGTLLAHRSSSGLCAPEGSCPPWLASAPSAAAAILLRNSSSPSARPSRPSRSAPRDPGRSSHCRCGARPALGKGRRAALGDIRRMLRGPWRVRGTHPWQGRLPGCGDGHSAMSYTAVQALNVTMIAGSKATYLGTGRSHVHRVTGIQYWEDRY